MRISLKVRNKICAWLFTLPTFILLTITITIPTIYTMGLGFCSWNIGCGEKLRYVGVEKYVEILVDSTFWHSLRVTMILLVGSVFFEFVLGLGIALLLNQKMKGRDFFRALFFLPLMMTPIIVGLQWGWLYNFQYGLINYILRSIRIPPPLWLVDSLIVLPAIIIVDIWQTTPFIILFLLAGLQTIPKQLYEAAEIDGASKLNMFKNITLPLLKPVILIILIMKSIFSFRMFDKIYVLTGGGPAGASTNLAMLMYKQAFKFWHLGHAATLGVIMFSICALMGIFYIKLIK